MMKLAVVISLVLLSCICQVKSKQRTYYIAAVEIDWNYNGPDSLDASSNFRKTVFREYKDGYFKRQKPHPTTLGYFGPTLVAEVGDTIVIRFKNLANISCNIIGQGVQLNSDSGNHAIENGEQTIQTWTIPHVSSPTYDDPACVNRLYYSNVNPAFNLNAGLVGTLIICKIGWIANVVDHLHPPIVLYFTITEEFSRVSTDHNHVSVYNVMYYHVNGFSNSTFQTTGLCYQQTQTWYLAGISSKATAFSVHLENHVIQVRSSHVSNIVTLTSGSTEVIEVDQTVDPPGSWRFYSKIDHQYLNGMIGAVQNQDCGTRNIFGRWWNRLTGHNHRNRQPNRNTSRWPNLFHNSNNDNSQPSVRKVRTYYIAAKEELWNYAPYNYNLLTGEKLTYKFADSKPYYEDGKFRIGSTYMKVRYVMFTDETFTQEVETNRSHGFLGPVIRIQTDETLRIVFKNLASKPFNIYLDGLLNFQNDEIAPGDNHTYEYNVTQKHGPALNEKLCWTRSYYSNVNPVRDVASGLMGPLLVCKSSSLTADGLQDGITKEMFLYFSTINENLSWYIDENIAATTLTRNVSRSFLKSNEFIESNKMSSINGYAYGNLLGLEGEVGDKISLHILCSGTDLDLHSISIANQMFSEELSYDQVDQSNVITSSQVQLHSVELAPGSSKTVYFTPQTAGKHLISTQNLEARRKGMEAYFVVTSNSTRSLPQSTEEAAGSGYVRWYYIAAVEQMWDYNHHDRDTNGGNSSNNTVYKKVIYEEYSDDTFTRKKQKDPKLGLLGPVIKAEVGDTIKVVFNNQGCQPFSVQPKGLVFDLEDAGDWVLADNDVRTDFSRFEPEFVNRGSVFTGHTHTYTWRVPESASFVGSSNPSECASSYYFSSTDPRRDIHSGLIGPLLLCNPGVLGTQGEDDVIRYDVDREYHVLLKEFDESQSWYAEENMDTGNWNHNGTNMYASVNGLSFGSLEGIEMEPGERIAWHTISMDSVARSMYFEGDPVLTYMNTGSVTSSYVETVSKVAVKSLLPGTSSTFTMVPSSTGKWKFGDFAAESIEKGMYGYYRVRPKECSNALGLESGLISQSQMTSSSVYVTRARFGRQIAKWKADYGRLNKKGQINAWIPSRSDDSPWIQVDLETPVRVTGIKLQGTADGHTRKYVTKFKILYSIDNRQWAFYRRQGTDFDMIFQGLGSAGNYFYNEQVTRTFSPHLLTRYIRLMPISWQNQPAVRMELLGCSLEGRCEDPQGITTGEIPDQSLTASSIFVYKRLIRWEPRFGRLHYEPNSDGNNDERAHGHGNDNDDHRRRYSSNRGNRGNDKKFLIDYAPAWGPSKNNRRQWIQVDLGHNIKVGGVVTQGVRYRRSELFVKSFILRYSVDGFNWNVYQDPVSGQAKVFRGNIDPINPVTQLLQNPVVARYVRIQPWTWRGRIAIRFEILGCAVGYDSNTYDSVTPVPENCIAK